MSTIYLIIIKLKCILHDLLSNNIIVRITNILVFNSFEVLCNIILKLIIIILPIILILLNSNDYNKFNIVEAQELNINKVNKSNIHNISKTPNKLIKADDVSSINYGFTKDIINTIVAPDNKTQKSNFNKYLLNNPNNLNHSGINYDKIHFYDANTINKKINDILSPSDDLDKYNNYNNRLLMSQQNQNIAISNQNSLQDLSTKEAMDKYYGQMTLPIEPIKDLKMNINGQQIQIDIKY